ncbi:MAG: YebC/PmpR family DNA-binding transcriptional regulator [Acidipropionibacterium acidipropionici]|jgi:YebC/PmpR family DNA-binding regulatory protein|uniref:Probable transcriptional regulatory protein A8L58_03525 n=2 Tax=Acidipropionibacterium acidipropionici TaxID=1748 RepID=A0A142KEA3_9ACTN|nr:YebC/PmpR family DNA-binding transcriptional regulator [Acidipropionibacterium acidipropionici]AFV89609.1 DNA-binding regulatory protein, YebC/PmpR family [Acidipropionibacterium acidipropionici ATCC 4875]ALN15948.1 transcriptional regulator [Acidipropionibacterium acidipropionici]AMS04441.1 transcriptional regulator [Acidipropionibacterium acidipropionici]AOZ45936.1 transcriptional regulator [Acidipropionibacterium acidipropionici]APZ08304.1 transcriptional regulator [Acidipropionibacteriu
MSGHSKWATTKHKKAAIDAKRGKLFAKLIKTIEVSARVGGGDPSGNPTLYDAIQKAKKNSVPNDNINRAVKRGSGEGSDAVSYETIMYEAYGPAGIAILIECLTDNRNRAVSDVRIAVTRNGGTMADGGSVQRLFERKGVVEVSKTFEVEEGRKTVTKEVSEDELMEATIDAEPEDIVDEGESFEVISDPNALVDVRKAVQAAGIDYESAEVAFKADFNQPVELDDARKLFKILDALDDLDDVQNVYSNADISSEVMAALEDED